MFARLASFAKKHKHCNVPTNDKGDPQLGRWVAAQRHRRKLGGVTPEQVRALDKLGFVWCPSEVTWDRLCGILERFKQKYGHCNVPTKWPKNVALADWVQRQRLYKKRGKLSQDRVRRLDRMGFSWAIYKGEPTHAVEPPASEAEGTERAEAGERLYCIKNGQYVQHNGNGKRPAALDEFARTHDGELPPYIPLPVRPVEFCFGEGWQKPRKIRWLGHGRLPADVLDYVCEHGTLPHHD